MIVPTPKAASRAGMGREALEVEEDATCCTHCGSRTEILRDFITERIERCLFCKQEYVVTDAPAADAFDPADPGEIDVVDDAGNVVGTTAVPKPGMETPELDKLLIELMDDVPMANQDDLNHLFGIKPAPPSPYGDDFGSFG
jgi:hypothetical protein